MDMALTAGQFHLIPDRVVIHPLEGFIDWARFISPLQGPGFRNRERPLVIRLKGWHLGFYRLKGKWEIRGDTILVYPGFAWNGASGIVIDNSTVVLASLIHDIICTANAMTYWKRHRLYWSVMRAQSDVSPSAVPNRYRRAAVQMINNTRAGAHWAGLISMNWAYSLVVRSPNSDLVEKGITL